MSMSRGRVVCGGAALAALLSIAAATAAQGGADGSARTDEPSGLALTAIDVEGGAATLIVTPAGESVLIDAGNPGGRDAGRIRDAIRAAGLSQVDHYITTHWHADHFGAAAELAKEIPIVQWYGHQFPEPPGQDINPELVAGWRGAAGEPRFLKAGDTIDLKGARGTPRPRIRVLAADGAVPGEEPGAPAIRTCEGGHEARPEDPSDNARSLALLVTYGDFDLFAGGDLTWNIEHKLTCPERLVPKVDAFLVNHHGLDSSNHPALIGALDPTVAIVNNGPRKGAEPRTMKLLMDEVGVEGVFQLHRNVRQGAVNTESGRIANDPEQCQAVPIHLRVDRRGREFTVEVPSRGTERRYRAD